jgi:hypothetical protein
MLLAPPDTLGTASGVGPDAEPRPLTPLRSAEVSNKASTSARVVSTSTRVCLSVSSPSLSAFLEAGAGSAGGVGGVGGVGWPGACVLCGGERSSVASPRPLSSSQKPADAKRTVVLLPDGSAGSERPGRVENAGVEGPGLRGDGGVSGPRRPFLGDSLARLTTPDRVGGIDCARTSSGGVGFAF